MKLKTIKVVRGDSYAIINKSDRVNEDRIYGIDYDAPLPLQGSLVSPVVAEVEKEAEQISVAKKTKAKAKG